MRKSTLIFSKLTLILLLFTLAISSCKKDENLQQQDTNISKFNFEKKSYNDIQLNEILSHKLKRIQKSKVQRRLTDRIFNNGFTIDTLNVLQITNNETGAVNFRFNVTLDNPIPNTSAVLNIHLGNNAESTTAILTKVTYPDAREGEEVHPELLSEQLDVTPEEFDALSISSRDEIICWTTTVIVEHDCSSGVHHVGDADADECTVGGPYTTLEEETNCEFIHHSGSLGGGGGSTIPTNGGAPNLIPGFFVYTGFSTYDEFLEFKDFMGWGNSESSTSLVWWLSPENRNLVNIFSSIYKNNSNTVFADAMNAIIDSNLHLDNGMAMQVSIYLNNNNYSTESCQFVLDALKLMDNEIENSTTDNYPGMDDNLPFNWWNDSTFIENSGEFNIPNESNTADETPNIKELLLFRMFPYEAIQHIKNSHVAMDRAVEVANDFSDGINGIHNGKADAFRHAYWNALGTADFGDLIMKLFADAHEWNQSGIEVTMDLTNNIKGRNIAVVNGFNSSTDETSISNTIEQAVFNGTLVYINNLNTIVNTNQ